MGSFKPPASLAATYNDVNIIGAGISGLAHAVELVKRGVPPEKICIIEARDRIGGRVHTVHHGNRRFETGARWFHGGKQNRAYIWLQQEGLKHLIKEMFGVAYFSDLFIHDTIKHAWHFNRSGALVMERSPFRLTGDELTTQVYEKIQRISPGKDVAIAELAVGADALVKGRVRQIASTWMGNVSGNISAREVFSEGAGSGGMQFKAGGEVLMQTLGIILKDLGVTFELNHRVTKISEHMGGDLTLECATPDGVKHLHSRAVFMTVPVGVLKKRGIVIEPDLSPEDWTTINNMDMCNLGRVGIPVRDRFFRDRPEIKINTRIDNDSGEHASFLHCRPAGENTIELIGYKAAVTDLRQMRKTPLLRAYSDYMKDEPITVDWGADPLAGGTYSICKVGTDRPHQNIGRGRLRIGGEAFASNEEGGATLEGAVVSAVNGAEEIAKLLNVQPLAAKWFRAIRPPHGQPYRSNHDFGQRAFV